MRVNRLKQLQLEKRVAVNAWISMGNGYLAEVLGHCNFDAVTVDLQHGPYGFDQAVHLLQAISATEAVPLARCAGSTLAEINKLLDAGAYGIICPLIDDVDQAAVFAASCRYPPRGARSYGPARGLLYGGSDYLARADDQIMSLAMIETSNALDNVERMLDVEELDGIYVGPSDLGIALGLGPDAWSDPRMKAAVTHILEVAHARGKYAGIFCGAPDMGEDCVRIGYDLVTPGNDVQLLRAGAAARVDGVRRAAAGHSS
ncbi:HpcH/HpaI aldolase/citrate lyase family protein [Glaciimonas sp. PCH181]|uniref:HpcH/HpaI aldolase family protein n=1 Tax=Glaciimonas sp. PCH181 TaxID=2133943 RepID=UPI000D3BDB1C|nr:aldolase/citrate lyase family protein [Glaciimonas sp. PCH181]PUA19519.1 2,4-dihydroxyhept-2-ene-1,7-dioic acid aldolase [Glaciimonas sp. PCH181]